MRFIGRREGVPPELVERMDWAEETTAANERIVFFVAFNYGGRAEIVDAARSFQGGSEEEFRSHLYAPEMHDPDLLITNQRRAAASPTTCSGSAPTRSWSSATSSGPTSAAPRFEESLREFEIAPPPLRGEDLMDLFDDDMFEDEPPARAATAAASRAQAAPVAESAARPPSGSSSRFPGSSSRSRSSSPAGSSSRSR